MAERIAVANFKGGVAKSQSAVSCAVCLARLGYRVLLVDLDAQANASEVFLPEDRIQFDMRSAIKDRVPLDQVIRPTRIDAVATGLEHGYLHVLPATFDLAYLDPELVLAPDGILRISRQLARVDDRYDFMVMDTGPNLSRLTLGALVAAQHIVIPVAGKVWSAAGLRKFLRWIDVHRDEQVLTAKLLGVVATMIQPSRKVDRKLLEDLQSSALPVFRTWTPHRVQAEDMAWNGQVVGDHGANLALTVAYQDLTDEIVEAIEKRA